MTYYPGQPNDIKQEGTAFHATRPFRPRLVRGMGIPLGKGIVIMRYIYAVLLIPTGTAVLYIYNQLSYKTILT
jgi:hypothetical protein